MILKYQPDSLIIDQTIKCNLKCCFCHKNSCFKSSYESDILPFELYKKIIDDIKQFKINDISLNGPSGESLLVKDLAERAEYSKNFKITLNTNAVDITKVDIEKLMRFITNFQISIGSINPITYEKIHGINKLEQVLDNIKILIKLKKHNIKVRFVECEYNSKEWDEYLKFFKSLNGINEIFKVSEHSFMDVLLKHKNKVVSEKCNQMFKKINFNCSGSMTTCCLNYKCEPNFGNIENKTIKEMWESNEYENYRKNRLKLICNDCSGIPDVIKVEKYES